MIWIGALVLAMVLAAIVVHVGRKPAQNHVHSARDILRAFTTLEVGGREGTLLFIEQPRSGRFLQFRLDRKMDGRASISFGFPNVAWSVRWYSPLQAALKAAGLSSSESVGSDGTKFLDVNGLTVPQAMVVAQLAVSVLELSDLSSLRFHFEGSMEPADIMVFNERLREYDLVAKYA